MVRSAMVPSESASSFHPRKIRPTYSVQVGVNDEIFPVFANHAAMQLRDERTWGTVAVTVHNNTDEPLEQRVSVQFTGWSDAEIQMARMEAGETHTLLFAPTFYPRLYRNNEISAATVDVKVTEMSGRTAYEETVPVRIRAAGDMFWGEGFKFAPYIASWVTPHDARVEMALAQAKEFAPNRRLPGYEDWKDSDGQAKETEIQARAIYRALQAMHLSYVKSSLTFGASTDVSERIRLPRQSLREDSANCIDGVLLYASMFENLGMDPVVVLVPGHAYVGVRVARESTRFLYFDTVLTGRADFDSAVAAADRGMVRYPQSQVITVHIADARHAGIYPLPEDGTHDAELDAPYPQPVPEAPVASRAGAH
jgi:hypothetical protein